MGASRLRVNGIILFHLGAFHFLVVSDNLKRATYVEVFDGMIFL